MLGRYDTYSEKVFVVNNIFYTNFQWAVNQAAQCFNGFWFFHQQWAHNTGWIELKHEKPKQQNQQNDAATWCGPRFLWSAYTIKQDTMSDMKNHPEKEKRHIQTTWCFDALSTHSVGIITIANSTSISFQFIVSNSNTAVYQNLNFTVWKWWQSRNSRLRYWISCIFYVCVYCIAFIFKL